MRMPGVVELAQPRRRNLRIDLCCGQAAVAQKLLDHFQICAVVQKMRREAVAKAVRLHMIMQRALSDVFVNDVDHTAPRQPRAHVV